MALLFLRTFKIFKFPCESLFSITRLTPGDHELNKLRCTLPGDASIHVYIRLIMSLRSSGELRFVHILTAPYPIRVTIWKKKFFLMNSVYIDALLSGNGSCKESSSWKTVKLTRNTCIQLLLWDCLCFKL